MARMSLFSPLVSVFFLVICLSTNASENLMLSTTTSTENSGLVKVLNLAFEEEYGVKVKVIAAGTGKALKIGSRGDVDVVLVHAPLSELKYVKEGYFIDRRAVMHNDFVIIGPSSDPADLSVTNSVVDAMKKLMSAKVRFVSRGDDSGTHKKELTLWKDANLSPIGNWYIQAGQGMGAVIKMADELKAYTLTDRGTYLAFKNKINLKVLYEGDEVLFNPYHIMAVNPERFDNVQYGLAKQYIQFVTGKQGQLIILNFKMLGHSLYYPDVIN